MGYLENAKRMIFQSEKGATSSFGQTMYSKGLTDPAISSVQSSIPPEEFAQLAEQLPDGTWKVKNPEAIAERYILTLDQNFRKYHQDYDKAPDYVKEALLDSAYNIGPQIITGWPKLTGSIKNWDWQKTAYELLDAESVGHRNVIGLAKRRAKTYNHIIHGLQKDFEDVGVSQMGLSPVDASKMAEVTYKQPWAIDEVTQGTVVDPTDGLISYKSALGKTLKEAQGLRHPESLSTNLKVDWGS